MGLKCTEEVGGGWIVLKIPQEVNLAKMVFLGTEEQNDTEVFLPRKVADLFPEALPQEAHSAAA